MKIDRCPLSLIGGDVWSALEMVGFAEKGNFPNGQGTLNKTQAFLDALRFTRGHEAAIKLRLAARAAGR